MMKLKKAGMRGYTMTELIFVCALTAVLALMIGGVFSKGQNLFDVNSAQYEAQRNGRRILESISTILRQARLSTVYIPSPPNNNQISFDLPLFQATAGTCSAFAHVSSGTFPVRCDVGGVSDCNNSCGSIGNNICAAGICRRTYTYSIASAQLILSAANEPNRVVGNRVQSAVFRDRITDPNLNPNEIRVTVVNRSNVVSEKRTHRLTSTGIVQVHN